jgi:predicted dehydrogenase
MREPTVKVSVIGAGWFAAESHIPALARRADVVLDGVCRLGATELARVKDHFGFAFASEDYRAVLARHPDAVVVSSPHHLHHEHAKAALEAGAHVLCEKPMTVDPAQAWDLVATAERRGLHLLIANGYHYLPRMAEVQRWIADGAVGTVEHVSCHFASATRKVFAGSEGLGRWRTAFFRPDRSTWQDPAQGGGFAYGQLSHSVALMFWLTGLDAASVAARLAPGSVDLFGAAIVEFRGAAIGGFTGAASVPEGGRQQLRLHVGGTEGVFALDVDLDRAEIRRHDGHNDLVAMPAGAWVYHCHGPVDGLVDLALGRGANLSPGHIGAKTVEVIAAMHCSAASGGVPVGVPGGSPP